VDTLFKAAVVGFSLSLPLLLRSFLLSRDLDLDLDLDLLLRELCGRRYGAWRFKGLPRWSGFRFGPPLQGCLVGVLLLSMRRWTKSGMPMIL
jgi:hypothetical protein